MSRIKKIMFTVFLAVLISGMCGCEEEGWEKVGREAPDFALKDHNPSSPTFDGIRSVSGTRGAVIVIYFADYA